MHEPASGRTVLAITFTVRGRFYALEQLGTANLLPWLQRYVVPSAAPGVPEWCLGLLNVRGTVQLLADLGHLLGYGLSEPSENTRLIFIEQGSAHLGLLVDTEIGVRYLRPSTEENSAEAGPFTSYPALLENRPVTVLDGAAIIRHVASELGAPSYAA